MKIVITGATGFIGKALIEALVFQKVLGADTEVRLLVRDPRKVDASLPGVRAFVWDSDRPAPIEALAGADAVVHLAGEGIGDARWTRKRKKRLYDSRIAGTRSIVAGIKAANNRPKVLVSGSAIGIYGARPGREVDESTPGVDTDFLSKICLDWEAEAKKAEPLGVRVVLLRTGIVLGKDGGALAQMLPPFRLGLGGPIAGGSAWMSWISLADEVGLILHAIRSVEVVGPLNAVAGAATNRDFTKSLGRVLRRPTVFPIPAFALKARFGAEMADAMLLSSQQVKGEVARNTGYRFTHPDLDSALRAAL